jgi:hypothetical protein
MSRYHHPPLRDVTAEIENTASSIVACWTVFTELLPGKAFIKPVTLSYDYKHIQSVLLEEQVASQLVQKFPSFYGSLKCIPALERT